MIPLLHIMNPHHNSRRWQHWSRLSFFLPFLLTYLFLHIHSEKINNRQLFQLLNFIIRFLRHTFVVNLRIDRCILHFQTFQFEMCKKFPSISLEITLYHLKEPQSIEKIMIIDDHIGCAMSGLTADARTLIEHGRVETQVRSNLICGLLSTHQSMHVNHLFFFFFSF